MLDWAPEIRKRLASAKLSPTREAGIVEELSQHLEDRRSDLVAGGADPEEATRLALSEFVDRNVLAQRVAPPRPWLGSIFDLRQSLRGLRNAPSFTVVALIVLTLGIGATTAIVSVVDAVIVRSLPFPDPGRLVAVGEFNFKTGSDQDNPVAPQNFIDWRARQDVFTALAAVGYASVHLKPEGTQEPEILTSQAVTADFFKILGIAPMLGGPFSVENEREGSARVAVISHGLWQRRFGSAPDVVGRYLHGQLADFRIVGVMPRTFAYPVGAFRPTEVWLPNVFRAEEHVRGNSYSYRLQVIGRLRLGVSIERAQAQMDQITKALAAETPKWFEERVAKVEFLDGYLTKSVRGWMFLLIGAVGFVLLIACVNLSNLMLARASGRTKEFGIRSALGASRWDIARSLLIESLLLSLVGATLGTFVAWLGVEVLKAAMPAEMPRIADIAINVRVLVAAVAMAVLTGLIFSAVPMLHYSHRAPGVALTMVSRNNTASVADRWFRAALVVAEVALAVVLLVGAGLFLASFSRVSGVNLGLDPHQVLTARVRPVVGAHNWKQAQRNNRGLLRNVLERVRTIPGVQVASLVNGGLPLRGDLLTYDLAIPGRVLPPNEDMDYNEISAEYFRALRVPLLKGRFFNDEDRQGSAPVVIINEAAAKKYFPGADAVGQVIRFEGLRTIVGVVGGIRHDGPEGDWRRQGFVPIDQSRAELATLVLRLSRDASEILPAVKNAIWSQFPGVALPDIQPLEQYLNVLIAQRRFNMLLLGLFGLLGIVIALVGIYGVMAYDVALRTREMGIRLALGAVPEELLRSVLGRASVYLATGLVIGLTAAWGLGGLIGTFLFQIQPHDISIYAGVGALLVIAGLAAALVPARRAARVDPLVSLRLE